jgi:predicted amidohydrolase
MNDLRVTIVQSIIHWENISTNLEMLSSKLAPVTKTDLIVLPEMFSTGFSMNAASLAESMDGAAVQLMQKMAAEKKCACTGSLIIKADNKFYNRLVWVKPDGDISTYDKRHLFTLSNEQETYTAGTSKMFEQINGWNICPLICYDLRFPVWSRNTHSANYELLLYVANWPERRNYAWKQLLVARAIENQSFVVGVNRVGNDGNNIYHSGDSMCVDPTGKIIYHKEHLEDIFTVTLSRNELETTRKLLPFLNDADHFNIVS